MIQNPNRTTIVAFTLAISLAILLSLSGCGPTTGSYNPNDPNRPNGTGEREQREVCCNQAAPAGFIKFNDKVDLNKPDCRAGDLGARNVCMYVRYDNLPSGTPLDICLGQTIPSGWSEVPGSRKYEAGRCGGNTTNADNVVTIKKN